LGDRVSTSIRRARQRGANSERFDPMDVLNRDGWICQLCGIKTLKSQRGKSSSRAPVVDHIIPLALGGEHTRRNVQCACYKCNAAKGAKAQGQLRMFA
jgi:5-methylcytosine-specific restriction endonuclease McrA